MGLGSVEQPFVAVHEADIGPAVENGVDDQVPIVKDDAQDDMVAAANDDRVGGHRSGVIKRRPRVLFWRCMGFYLVIAYLVF